MSEQILKNTKVVQAITPTAGAAGTSAINGTTIDMSGFEGIQFVVTMGTITSGAVTSLKWQQDTDSAMGTAADLLGTGMTVADTDDEKIFVSDLFKPRERYVRVVCSRATQNAVCSGHYILYGAHKKPVTTASSTVNVESWVSPAEGTA